MSMMGSSNRSNMGMPSFHELKKQASFFLREQIKTARLALTDVTPAQLLTEEATDGNPSVPDTRTLKIISKAAFEVDDYWRIVEILHRRLTRFERKNWRMSYNALIVLEHLLTHGPESVAEEFRSERDVIGEMGSFQHIDGKGLNWGLNVRKKSERILKLLEKGPFLREERDRARKLTRGIQGFGSFCQRNSSSQGILQEPSIKTLERCHSEFNYHANQEDSEGLTKTKPEENPKLVSNEKMETPYSWGCSIDGKLVEDFDARTRSKENTAPSEEDPCTGERKALLDTQQDDYRSGTSGEEDHPFSDSEHQAAAASLLSLGDQLMQAC